MAELSSKEKKFLANQKVMQKIFGAYTEQAAILYEYMRNLDAEPELFDRFRHVHLRVDTGVQKSQGSTVSNGQTVTKNVNGVQYSQIKLFAMANKAYEFDSYNNKYSPENARLARCKFFNSKTAVLSSRRYHTVSMEQSKKRTLSPEERAVLCKNLRTSSLIDLISMHKTIYHELGHSMAKHESLLETPKIRSLPKTLQDDAKKEQVVHYVGVNPVYGYLQSKNKKPAHILWQNVGYKYLEEGVVDSIATECVESELVLDNINLQNLDKDTVVENLRAHGSKYTTPLCLVGMWNAISNDELTKQHLGKMSANMEVYEATEIFKDLFVDYITYLTGNTYNPRTKWTFTPQKLDTILQKYTQCVDFCEQYNAARRGSNAVSQYNKERFTKYHKLATSPEIIAEQVKTYIEVGYSDREYFAQKIDEMYGGNYSQKNTQKIEKKSDLITQENILEQTENAKFAKDKSNNYDFAKNNHNIISSGPSSVAAHEGDRDAADSMQR